MRSPRSLAGRIALSSLGLFLALYAAAFALVLFLEQRSERSELEITLYAEAESLAGYYAASGRLDFPELRPGDPSTPIPIWVRILDGDKIVAETPGTPALPVRRSGGDSEKLEIAETPHGTVALVRHTIWNRPGMAVEAMTTLDSIDRRQRTLMLFLGLSGLLLIPAAALGNSWVARRSLRPVDDLMRSIRELDSQRLEERLAAPGAVTEIAHLTEEFNRLLDRLEESVSTMQRFTADASHELRTPLSVLRVGLEVALRKERPPEEYREVLRENLLEIERIQRIVAGLLTLARAQHTDRPAVPDIPVDLSQGVADTVRSVEALAGERKVSLAAALTPGLRVHGDVDQLRLMILNLLDNAIKFTPEGKTVHVSLARRGEMACLTVRDEGPGIPPEDRARIFDRFFRGRGPWAAGAPAGGLGLSVVRWVAESHGGSVRTLDLPGAGATFEILLPLAPTAPA